VEINKITEQIIGAAIEVHRALGPGLLESAYEACLAHELRRRGLQFERQRQVSIIYDGIEIDCGFRPDLVAEDLVVVELKAKDKLQPIDSVQLLTYLRLMNLEVGLLINFNVMVLKDGVKRVVNNFQG
jgi:GxxExxY protein